MSSTVKNYTLCKGDLRRVLQYEMLRRCCDQLTFINYSKVDERLK